ncbi:MAG TPA: hypothetical protein VLL50_08570 [Usitatibacter sp.]|nr:hypothetical protein [Usitatibacter sp.]
MSGDKRAKAAVITDFLELGANAFVGGVMVAIALAAITLALASGAQAGALDDATTVLSHQSPEETRSAAPADDGSTVIQRAPSGPPPSRG